MKSKSRASRLVLALSMVAACPAAAADNYPTKPIRIIDPYAPGGSTEAQARIIGQKLTDRRPAGRGERDRHRARGQVHS
jgi:tripartite-type tricarboxylate transporter receptor subunit TctC